MGSIIILFAFFMSLVINLIERRLNPQADKTTEEPSNRNNQPALNTEQA